MKVSVDLNPHYDPKFRETAGHCLYQMVSFRHDSETIDQLDSPSHRECTVAQDIYPSQTLERVYDRRTPELFAGVVATTFVLVALVFYMYDVFVQKRNRKIVANAAQSSAIVTSLFPQHIRKQLMENRPQDQQNHNEKHTTSKSRINSLLSSSTHTNDRCTNKMGSKPMADLYLNSTVMFADIVGFTAWSSVREPTQVFELLESVYGSFDRLAKR